MAKKRITSEDLNLNIIINGDKAQAELGKLTRKLSDTKSEVKRLTKDKKQLEDQGKKNSTEYRKINAELEKQQKTLRETDARIQKKIKSMKLEDLTVQQLRKEYNRLRTLRNQSVPDSKQYKVYEQQLVRVKSRMDQLNRSTRMTGSAMNRLSKSFGGFRLLSATALFTTTIMSTRRAIDTFAEYDDKLADVRKTTNMLTEDLHDFDKSLQDIETRTSDEDMLGISWVGGKMGINDPDELRGFVESANQLVVALNKDLGGDTEETIRSVAKLVDVFEISDEFGMEQGLLKVGSAINELGMASTANEKFLIDFTSRLAGIAPLANVSIQEILALGSTLDQLGQRSEVSSTALNRLFLLLAKDAETYAQYAGMEVDKFRQLIEDDFMQGLIAVFDGIKGNSEGINALAKSLGDLGLDGQRVISVVGTLANNTDVLRGEIDLANQSFEEGISLTNEYAIKNTTVAAALEKEQKNVARLWRELGEKLWPLRIEGNNLLTTFLRIISSIVTFLYEYRKVIAVLTVTILAYNIALKASTIALYLQIKALEISTVATRVFNAAIRANPLGLLIAALTAAGSALWIFKNRTDAATKAVEEFNKVKKEAEKQAIAETSALERNLKAATDLNVEEKQRLAAVKELRDLMPDVLQTYSDEEIMIGKATKAIRDQIKELIKLSTIKAYENKLDSLAAEKVELRDQRARGQSGATITERIRSLPSAITNWKKSYVELIDDSLETVESQEKLFADELLKLQSDIAKTISPITEDDDPDDNEPIGGGKSDKDKKKKADAIAREKEFWKDMAAAQAEGYNQELYQLDKRWEKTKEILGKNHKDLAALEKVYQDQRSKILKEEADKDRKEEIKASKEQREALAQEWKQTYETAKLEAELYYQEKLQQIENSDASENEKRKKRELITEEHEKRLRDIEQERLTSRLIMLQALQEVGNLEIDEERRIADEILKIRAQLINDEIELLQKANKSKLEDEIKLMQATYEIKEETAKAFEAGFALLGNLVQENHQMANALLILEKAAAAAAVIINLQKELSIYAVRGATNPVSAAVNAARATKAKIRAGISLATIAGTAISGVAANNKKSENRVSGRASGGFFNVTRDQDGRRFRSRYHPEQRGYVDRPTVLVGEEGTEWVASAEALHNPDVSNIISILDTAQRQGQINTLGLTDIIRQSGIVQNRVEGRASGGSFSSTSRTANSPDSSTIEEALNQNRETMDKLLNEIQKGITANVSLLGRNGLEEQQKRLDNIRNKAKL